MSKGIYSVPYPINETVLSYGPGTPEREELKAKYKEMFNSTIDVPMYIGSEEVRTEKKVSMSPPHDHQHVIGHFNFGTKKHVKNAIDAAIEAKEAWSNMPWEHRVSIFLKAADLLAGPYRAKLNAATMLAQSKKA